MKDQQDRWTIGERGGESVQPAFNQELTKEMDSSITAMTPAPDLEVVGTLEGGEGLE